MAPSDDTAPARAARDLLATNLRRLRRERGMTQEALSHASGLRQSYLSEIESAKRNVSLDNIGVLAHALEVSLARMFEP